MHFDGISIPRFCMDCLSLPLRVPAHRDRSKSQPLNVSMILPEEDERWKLGWRRLHTSISYWTHPPPLRPSRCKISRKNSVTFPPKRLYVFGNSNKLSTSHLFFAIFIGYCVTPCSINRVKGLFFGCIMSQEYLLMSRQYWYHPV